MKKFFFLVVVLAILGSTVACQRNVAPSVPYSQLSFELESNPKYLGSYTISRTNGTENWTEWGEWSSAVELGLDGNRVCFGYFSNSDTGTFRNRSDYNWIECKDGSRNCLCLEKRQ